MSLAPFYEGEPAFAESMAAYAADGYAASSITPNFVDPDTGYEMLDVNVLFVRDCDSCPRSSPHDRDDDWRRPWRSFSVTAPCSCTSPRPAGRGLRKC